MTNDYKPCEREMNTDLQMSICIMTDKKYCEYRKETSYSETSYCKRKKSYDIAKSEFDRKAKEMEDSLIRQSQRNSLDEKVKSL